MVGLNQEQIVASREGKGNSEKATAALTFAKRVLDSKGQIKESDLAAARAAGFSDGEIARDHRSRCIECLHKLLQYSYRGRYRPPEGLLLGNRLSSKRHAF
jgi:hypothetical protein